MLTTRRGNRDEGLEQNLREHYIYTPREEKPSESPGKSEKQGASQERLAHKRNTSVKERICLLLCLPHTFPSHTHCAM